MTTMLWDGMVRASKFQDNLRCCRRRKGVCRVLIMRRTSESRKRQKGSVVIR